MLIIQCTEKEEYGLKKALRCANIQCYGSCCDNCFGQVRDDELHNVKFVRGVESVDGEDTSSLTKESLAKYCSLSKCGTKNSKYDCMFMVNGTCQLDYHCPADLSEEAK